MLWHLTAGFLYLEMFLVFLMMLPILSTRSWAKLFKSNWVKSVANFSSFYFNFFLLLLVIVLTEALRQVYAQRNAYNRLKEHPSDLRPETESLYLMRMFRAQRNLYIAGFALFMWFVFRRLIRLISDHAQMSASQEASLKQAQSASDAASRMLSASRDGDNPAAEKLKEEVERLTEELEEEKSARETAERNLTTLKRQAEQTEKEYDRVSGECQELQRRLDILSGSSSDKKSD